MADEFKSHDKTPILDALKNMWFRLSLKNLIFVAVVVALVLVCIIFAGLFGKTKQDLTEVEAATSSAFRGSGLCLDTGCMKTATRAMEYRNASVDPCVDFYEYACGNYLKARPFKLKNQTPYSTQNYDVLGDISEDNQDKLIDLIEQPISEMHDYAAERKLKQMFQACNDMFSRDLKKGLPLLTQIFPEIGGWKVIGTWQNDTWDLNTVLKKVTTDFWTGAFNSLYMHTDWYDVTKPVIELAPTGMGYNMHTNWYLDPQFEKYRQDYRKFIRRVGSMLARDAVDFKVIPSSIQSLDTLLDEFVNDSFAIESKLAFVLTDSDFFVDRYAESNKVSLDELTAESKGIINWTQLIAYEFNTAGVNGATRVVLTHKEYFKNVANMVASLPDADRNRMLHNYLIWRIAERYVEDLSWDYVHANREMNADLHNRKNFMGIFRICFFTTSWYMRDALGSLYINRFFNKESRDSVHDITDNIRQALKEQLEKTPWMDKATKQYAKEKLNKLMLKIGYPDWMDNMGYIDQMYSGLTVNVTDHFNNILSGDQHYRFLMNEFLKMASDGGKAWDKSVFSTLFGVTLEWNQVEFTAGILQFPIYSKRQPHSATFGSFGALLARFLHHFIDSNGWSFDKNGQMLPNGASWWSNKSLNDYDVVQKCVADVYNITKTYQLPDGTTKEVKVKGKYSTPDSIAWTSGIRLAIVAYRDWMKNLGVTEDIVPGLGLTNEQMLFLAHAQTFCYEKTNSKYVNRLMAGYPNNDLRINMALGQIPEFAEAYQCKKGTPMNHDTKCDYF